MSRVTWVRETQPIHNGLVHHKNCHQMQQFRPTGLCWAEPGPAGHWAGHSTEFVHPSQLSRGPVSSGPPTAPLLRSWQWQLEQENIPRVLLLCQGWLSEAMETPRFPQKAIVKFIRHHVLLWTVLRKQDLTDPQSTPFTSLANWEQRPSCKHLTNKQVQNTSCKD